MAEILKKQSIFQKATPVPNGSDEPSSGNAPRHPRVIKSAVSASGAPRREIPITTSESGDVLVRPLGNGRFVEGVEIRCRCGETIVIHFDYDPPESKKSV
jgi:hypothetical protein